jgi:hypothetical protein
MCLYNVFEILGHNTLKVTKLVKYQVKKNPIGGNIKSHFQIYNFQNKNNYIYVCVKNQ